MGFRFLLDSGLHVADAATPLTSVARGLRMAQIGMPASGGNLDSEDRQIYGETMAMPAVTVPLPVNP
jgi:hypothetical protein